MNTLLILKGDDEYALYLPYNTQQYPEDSIEELYPFKDMYGGHILDVFNDPEPPPPEPDPEPKKDPSYYGQYPAPNNACRSCNIDYDGLGLIICSNCPPEPTPEDGYSSIDELIDDSPLEDYINPLRDFSIYSLDDLFLFQLDIGTAYDLWN